MVLCKVVWSKDIGGEVCCIVCVKGEGLGVGCGIFSLWMNFGFCGGNGDLVMKDGPEIAEIVCLWCCVCVWS